MSHQARCGLGRGSQVPSRGNPPCPGAGGPGVMIFVNIFSAVERTDPSPAEHRESHSQFIDRVAGPFWDQVRNLVEEWFSRLCSDAQADVKGRLRSRDDRQSKGAFF